MGKSSKPDNEFQETALSTEQLKILRSRESFFQDFSQPALESFFTEAQNFQQSDDFQVASVSDFLRVPAAQIGCR